MQLPSPHPQGKQRGIVISVNDRDKPSIVEPAKKLLDLGFEIFATGGTYKFLQEKGVECRPVYKVQEGRPNIVDHMKNGLTVLVINTPLDQASTLDEKALRRCALELNIPYVTTISAAQAAVLGIASDLTNHLQVKAIQDYFPAKSQ